MTAEPRAKRLAVGVAILTAIGFALRIAGIDESYFGDELYTADILFEDDPAAVIDRVRATESTPPLYYLLGWATGQFGDTLDLGRLPSVIFGTLAIPVTYLLGARTVGRAAGLAGAAIVTFAPTAIFYSTEARAYGVLLFLATLALVLLLRALERGDGWSWVAFVVCAALALYTHYTAAFPIGAGLLWALWRHPEQRRATVIAGAVAVVAYLPWVPSIVANPLLELGTPLSFDSAVRFVFRLLPGHPYVTLPELPGEVALVVLAAAVVAAAVLLVRARRAELWPPSGGVSLLLATGLATPLGLIVYSLLKTDIFQPRYLLAALPMYALLLGALLTAPRGRLAWATAGGAIAAVAVGGIATAWDDSRRRPPYAHAAEYLQQAAAPGDVVADVPLFLIKGTEQTVLDVNLPRERRVATALPVRRGDGTYRLVLNEGTWQPVRRGRSIFVVTPEPGGYSVPTPPRGLRLREVSREHFDGFIPLTVFEFRRAS